MKSIYSAGILLLSLLFVTSCNEPDAPSGGQFDRSMMLDNFAKNLIVPGFSEASTQTSQLVMQLKALAANPSEARLKDAQLSWQTAYSNYLKVSMYNFGPAEEKTIQKSLLEEVATFPVNIQRIANKTKTATPTFQDFERDSRGFLALDYLLFDEGALKNFRSNPNYANYSVKVAEDIATRIDEVNVAWATYQTEFVQNSGTDAGSSTSALYNEFVKNYEGLKNFKVGLPLGLRPGQSKSEPEKVEALYSGLSLEFIKNQFDALTNVWKGGNGLGFDDYLENVEGGPTLSVSTKEQINTIANELEKFSPEEKLALLISTDEVKVRSLHTELQKNTRFFKSELSSLLGIAITFTSGDGD
jgi:predicted lipoprotein